MVVRLTRNRVIALLSGLFMCWAPGELGCETFTLQTYYPSPAGIYNKMTTTADTVLARDSGGVGIGVSAPAVGVKLDVGGTIKIRGGSPGSGRVLTSDSYGNASWQAATATYAP